MYFENLAVVQDYPSPDGIWELVEKIGKEAAHNYNAKNILLNVNDT